MSRSGRSDTRDNPSAASPQVADREPTSRQSVPMDRLSLPKGPDRQPVEVGGRTYHLRDSEARILVTVGSFRVVRADDLQDGRSSRDAWTGDLRSLADQGLLQFKTVEINREPKAVVTLSPDGKQLLDAHRIPTSCRAQEFHSGFVKPREIAHDSQIHRLYQSEAARIEAEGGRIERVVLDYELKREYQRFLNRPDRPEGVSQRNEAETFAAANGLPSVDGHLELPDLRIEYETPEGRLEHRDVELVTEHYSRGQRAGKSAAGFALYRAAGAGRARGQSAARGGTPFDPHHMERLG